MNADALVAKWREEAREVQKRYGMWQAQRMLDCADELERLAASRPAPAPETCPQCHRAANDGPAPCGHEWHAAPTCVGEIVDGGLRLCRVCGPSHVERCQRAAAAAPAPPVGEAALRGLYELAGEMKAGAERLGTDKALITARLDAARVALAATPPTGEAERRFTQRELAEAVIHGIRSARNQWVCPHCEAQSAPGEAERLREALERLRAWARALGHGGCKVLSLGDACHCPLCDIDRLAAALATPDTLPPVAVGDYVDLDGRRIWQRKETDRG